MGGQINTSLGDRWQLAEVGPRETAVKGGPGRRSRATCGGRGEALKVRQRGLKKSRGREHSAGRVRTEQGAQKATAQGWSDPHARGRADHRAGAGRET